MEGLELAEWEGAAHGRGQSLFGSEARARSATAAADEEALIRHARTQLQRHKTQRRLSRIEKGALADRALQAGEVPFALRLGALMRCAPGRCRVLRQSQRVRPPWLSCSCCLLPFLPSR